MKPALLLGLALATNAMAADNELIMAPTDKFSRDLAQRFPGKIMFDDELFTDYPPVELFNNYEEWLAATRNYRISRDDAADDELGLKIVHLPPAEHVAYDDDELLLTYKDFPPQDGIRRFYTTYFNKETGKWEIAPGQYTKFTDDELWASDPSVTVIKIPYYRIQSEDDEGDDELGLRMVHRPIAAEHPYAFDDDELRIRPISVLPESVAADDELSFMPIPPKVFVNKEWFKTTKTTPEALIRDDEGDDELAYLGELIKDRGFVPRTFDDDDDELSAEKPSHVKAEERAQLKSELPKKPRRWRPHPDVIPMTEN